MLIEGLAVITHGAISMGVSATYACIESRDIDPVLYYVMQLSVHILFLTLPVFFC